MKRKSVVFLTAVLIFLAGCVASGIPSESEYVQTGISKYITEENGKYTLTLPKSQATIKLRDNEDNFVDYIKNNNDNIDCKVFLINPYNPFLKLLLHQNT